MRKIMIAAVMAATLLSPGAVWKAQAMVGAGGEQVVTAAESQGLIKPVTCRGWGIHCPPGYFWNGYRCRPCW